MKAVSSIVTAAALLTAAPALAGGYDTPILYSAQHMGMGGAAIGYVDDPTAMFHNPAGLARTMGLTLTVNATLILGSIQAAPTTASGTQESDPIMAIAPLIGISVRPVEWFAAGFAFYPVASAGADYTYDRAGTEVTNTTAVTFLELAPSVAFHLPGNVNIGASYRIILASLDRKVEPGDPTGFDASLSGTNFTGFRVGVQWDPIPELKLGLVMRNKTATTLVDESGDALTPLLAPDQRIETEFTLPTKLGFGAAFDYGPILVALDLEYALQSENEQSVFLIGENKTPAVTSIFRWEDALTLRMGVQYTVQERFMFRGGFLYDAQVSNEDFPSAFGTPPTSTTTITAGFGMKCTDTWKFNFGIAHRFGSTRVDPSPPAGSPACLPCSVAGDYSLTMTGVYLDFTYSFADLFD